MTESLLLVDDDQVFATVLARSMTRKGFQVITCHDPEQALNACRETDFAKAVVDLKLETASGLLLIPQLLNLQPGMQILMLTGYSSIATAVEAIKLGAVNYLCKPAGSEEILAAFNPGGEVPLSSSPPSVDRLEWEHIQRVLADHNGNISATARTLGMHRRTLQRKLQKRPVKN